MPPVPSHLPSPGHVPPLSLAGTVGGAFVVTFFDVAEAAAGFLSLTPVTDGAAKGERFVVVVVLAAAEFEEAA